MQKILITGGTGLLAINWAFALRDKMHVTLITHSRSININKVSVLNLDLNSIKNIISAIENIKPDYVIHTAGLTSVEKCELDPKEAFFVNAQLAENVALACLKTNTQMVHISTDHLYDGGKSFFSEQDNVCPLNIYGESKAAAEKKILDLGSEVLIIRTNFYGWGPRYRQSFSDNIIKNLRSGMPLKLFEDVFYTPIYIGTLIRLVHELLVQKSNGIFNIVGNERLSKYDFGMSLAKFFNLDTKHITPSKIIDHEFLAKRPNDMSLNNAKIIKKLGFKIHSMDKDFEYLLQDEKKYNISKIQSSN